MKNDIIRNCSYSFTNGVTVVNATPHPINFLSPEGETITVGCSVLEGDKTGPLVINARADEEVVDEFLVCTKFKADKGGEQIIDGIQGANLPGKVMIIGSMIAVSAYPGKVVGMTPAPGFERVPPAQKLMRCDKFTVCQP